MTFLEGLLSFLSPCILPMLPVYLIYFAGGEGGSRRQTALNAVAFVLGFSTVFVLLGVFAGTLGSALAAHRAQVDAVCGALIVLFGLSFLGVFRLPAVGATSAARSFAVKIRGPFSALVFGLVFALGLTPCVGAFLGAALMTAASEGGAARGARLLAEYSLGLGVPFVASALAIRELEGVFGFFKAHARGVSAASGLLLIAFGAWTALAPFVASRPVQEGDARPVENKENKTMEITLNAANFEAEVLKCEKPVIVDFWAPWCGPCRMLAPELEALAAEWGDAVKVGKVNVDENPELCAKYGIVSIPAVFVFRNGAIAAQSVGYQKKDALAALLAR